MLYQPTPQHYSPAIIFQEGQRQNYNNVTQKLTIAIDENRLTEIRLLVECWMHKMMASKKELQSLLGKLNFVAQCVKQLGKEEWKYLPFIHPPHPSKHASTDNISSGLENSSDNIMETPLYNGKNVFHHNKSSLEFLFLVY
jgi:hypothetical protein